MPVLPETQRHRAKSYDADPLRYLRGVLAFFLGLGTVVALVLALAGVTPNALILAGLLWALFGLLTGMVDFVLEPAADFIGELFASISGPGVAPEGPDRVGALLHRAEQLAGPMQKPEVAARELEAAQRKTARLDPKDDIRLGLALADLYEQKLHDPGRALGTLRGLIDRHPRLRETIRLDGLVQAIRTQHASQQTP